MQGRFKGDKQMNIWMLKKEVVAYFNVLSLNLPEGTEEIKEKPQSGWPVSEPRFEPGTS